MGVKYHDKNFPPWSHLHHLFWQSVKYRNLLWLFFNNFFKVLTFQVKVNTNETALEEYCLVPFNPITIVFKYISLHKRKNCLWVRQRVILDAVRKGKLLLFRLINAHFYTTHIPWLSNPLFPGWIEIYIMIYMFIYIHTYTFICHNSTPYKDLGLTNKQRPN